eukprot:m.166671 g.166671  ORF g.166671 m.166671 type:complete len:449 (+) comp14446_c0_seq3:189-1535(+)
MEVKVTALKTRHKFTVLLESGSDTTVLALKEKIAQEHADYPVEQQVLVFSGKKLVDDQTLGSFSIQAGSQLFLGLEHSPKTTAAASASSAPSQISSVSAASSSGAASASSATTGSDFVLTILVVGEGSFPATIPNGPRTTVYQLKQLIEEQKPGLGPERQTVIFNGQRLDDSVTLGASNIVNGSTIYVGKQPAPETEPVNPDDSRTKQEVIQQLLSAMQEVKRAIPFAQFVDAAKLIATVMSNLVDHPDEDKYKRLHASNKRIKALLETPGGEAAVKALGFMPSQESQGQFFIRYPSAHLREVKRLFLEAMNGHGITLRRPRTTREQSQSTQQQPPLGMPPNLFGAMANPPPGLMQAMQSMMTPENMQAMQSAFQGMAAPPAGGSSDQSGGGMGSLQGMMEAMAPLLQGMGQQPPQPQASPGEEDQQESESEDELQDAPSSGTHDGLD